MLTRSLGQDTVDCGECDDLVDGKGGKDLQLGAEAEIDYLVEMSEICWIVAEVMLFLGQATEVMF